MKFTVRDLVEGALLVALAIVAEFLEIPVPGGHVSLAFVPLVILALRNGPIKTFIFVGIVYSVVDCLRDGYGFATFPLEYLIAFGSLCIISLFRKQLFGGEKNIFRELAIILGAYLIHSLIRVTCGTIDSMIIYEYEFVPALVYNLEHVAFDSLFTYVVVALIYVPLRTLNVKKFVEEK